MGQWLRRSVVALAIGAGAATYAFAAAPSQVRSARETSFQGLIARLPHIGTLTWRCDGQRFFTKLTLPTPGAGVTVSVTTDGQPVWRGRRVDPLPPPRHGTAGPFEARRIQIWTIRYHHMPATLKVVARLRFAAPRPESECLVARSVVDTRRTPH